MNTPGKPALQNLLGAQFVRRIAIAMQKQDRDGLDLVLLASRSASDCEFRFVQRLADASVG